ncbi:hypothetical protein Micbo1qcDRAFT_162920, partial [Microdochium bolleyi]
MPTPTPSLCPSGSGELPPDLTRPPPGFSLSLTSFSVSTLQPESQPPLLVPTRPVVA